MLTFLSDIFSDSQLSPHGICLLWRPELIWLHVISDFLIGLSYYSIPIALTYFVIKRRDIVFGWVLWMFAAFILLCGTGHWLGEMIGAVCAADDLIYEVPPSRTRGEASAFSAAMSAHVTEVIALEMALEVLRRCFGRRLTFERPTPERIIEVAKQLKADPNTYRSYWRLLGLKNIDDDEPA